MLKILHSSHLSFLHTDDELASLNSIALIYLFVIFAGKVLAKNSSCPFNKGAANIRGTKL